MIKDNDTNKSRFIYQEGEVIVKPPKKSKKKDNK